MTEKCHNHRPILDTVNKIHQNTKDTQLTLYLIEMPFDALANREDPDQAALVRAA